MAGDADNKPQSSDENAGSETGTGTSASDASATGKPVDEKSPKESKSSDLAPDEETTSVDSEPGTGDTGSEEECADSEQLALPGMPEKSATKESDPDHHDEHDQYHDEYHEENYDHDDEHHDDYYEGYHDDHPDPHHADGALVVAGTAASQLPLDQRSLPECEPDLDDDGNPYGGPVKPFLDHLEDLRWTILKCVFTMLIAMMACMMGAKHLINVLVFPLEQAKKLGFTARADIPVMLGRRVVGRLKLDGLNTLGMDTNAPVFSSYKGRIELVPVVQGTNIFLALNPVIPESKEDAVMVELKNYGPFQSIWLCLQLALYGGLVLGAPFLIFFVAEFVLPALKVTEKKFLYKAAGIGSLLFMLGVAFCYVLIVQVALKASVEFSLWMGFGADEWNASEYVSFVVKFLLVMGVAFEMPVVLLTIVKIGILDYKKLIEMRSYFIVGMLVASAVITPSGDPFTMILVAIPLWILYEICIVIARVWYKRDEALAAAEADDSKSEDKD